MAVTVEVVNRDTAEVETDDETTVGELLDPFDLSGQGVIVLVDGRPVALDAEVGDDVETVRVVPAAQGG